MQSEINFKNVSVEDLKMQLMGIFMIKKRVITKTPVSGYYV